MLRLHGRRPGSRCRRASAVSSPGCPRTRSHKRQLRVIYIHPRRLSEQPDKSNRRLLHNSGSHALLDHHFHCSPGSAHCSDLHLAPAFRSRCAVAAGIACVANWRRNHTYHCRISGPILFLVGGILLIAGIHLIHVRPGMVWILAGAGIGISFLLECRYAARPSGQ